MIITALKKKTMMTSESDEEVAPSPQPTKMNTDRLPLGESVVTNRKERSQIMDYVATMNKLRGGGMPENADESVSRCRHKQSESKKAEKNHKART